MKFERIQYSSGNEYGEKMQKSWKSEIEKDKVEIAHNRVPEMQQRVESLRPHVELAIQQYFDNLGIDIDVSQYIVDVVHHASTVNNSDGVAFYANPGDIIGYDANTDTFPSDDTMLFIQMAHETFHAISGGKLHFTTDEEDESRVMSASGFRRSEQNVNQENEPVQVDYLVGFNEGVNQLLTFETIQSVYPEVKLSSLSYYVQTAAVHNLIHTMAALEQVSPKEYERELVTHYLKKDLFFLKKIKKHFGKPGMDMVAGLNTISDESDNGHGDDINMKVAEYFFFETTQEKRAQLHADVVSMSRATQADNGT